MERYLTSNTVIELICLLVAYFTIRTDRELFWRLSFLYILVTFLTEMSGIYLKIHYRQNAWLYNLYLLAENSYMLFGISYFLKKHIRPRKLIVTGALLFILIYAYGIGNNGILIFNNQTVIVMSVFYVFCSLYYFYLLTVDHKYVPLIGYPPFWWFAAILFFYFGSTISNMSWGILDIAITLNHSLRYYTFTGLNIILYGLLSYSFLCRHRQRKLQPS